MARPLTVVQTRDPNAYIYRALDTVARNVLQGWGQYNAQQRQDAAASLQFWQMRKQAAEGGYLDAFEASEAHKRFRDLYGKIPDLPTAQEHLGIKPQQPVAPAAPPYPPPPVMSGGEIIPDPSVATVQGQTVPTQQQAALARLAEAAEAPPPPGHMLAGQVPVGLAEPQPGPVPEPVTPTAVVAEGMLPPATPVVAPEPGHAPAPPTPAAPPLSLRQKVKERLKDPGISSEEKKVLNKYLKSPKLLKRLLAKADKLKAAGAVREPMEANPKKAWSTTSWEPLKAKDLRVLEASYLLGLDEPEEGAPEPVAETAPVPEAPAEWETAPEAPAGAAPKTDREILGETKDELRSKLAPQPAPELPVTPGVAPAAAAPSPTVQVGGVDIPDAPQRRATKLEDEEAAYQTTLAKTGDELRAINARSKVRKRNEKAIQAADKAFEREGKTWDRTLKRAELLLKHQEKRGLKRKHEMKYPNLDPVISANKAKFMLLPYGQQQAYLRDARQIFPQGTDDATMIAYHDSHQAAMKEKRRLEWARTKGKMHRLTKIRYLNDLYLATASYDPKLANKYKTWQIALTKGKRLSEEAENVVLDHTRAQFDKDHRKELFTTRKHELQMAEQARDNLRAESGWRKEMMQTPTGAKLIDMELKRLERLTESIDKTTRLLAATAPTRPGDKVTAPPTAEELMAGMAGKKAYMSRVGPVSALEVIQRLRKEDALPDGWSVR